MKTLKSIIEEKYPNIPSEVAQAFIKQRTIIRMKFLNEEIKTKRKILDNNVERKKKRKYNKLTT